jgi:hypothetical protein
MKAYLGIDAHGKTGLELAAISKDGELLWRDRCPLSSKLIAAAVQRAPQPCTVVFEQGELATWLHLTLRHLCDEVLVADPRHNRLIATSQDKNDASHTSSRTNPNAPEQPELIPIPSRGSGRLRPLPCLLIGGVPEGTSRTRRRHSEASGRHCVRTPTIHQGTRVPRV